MIWLIFTYKVPNQPSANRVYIWRKLKKIGALPLQNAVFVLPYNVKNREYFQWLSVEIKEMGGESSLFESSAVGMSSDSDLIDKFKAYHSTLYKTIFQKVTEMADANKSIDMDKAKGLYRQFATVRKKDCFDSEKGREILEMFNAIELRIKKTEDK